MTDTDYTPEQLDALKLFKPALYRVLMNIDPKPYGCANCPYATVEGEVNRMDADEGYYHCSLLNQSGIWGENPKCEASHWLAQARVEALPAVNEAKDWLWRCEKLYVEFVAAIYAADENETAKQVMQRVLSEASAETRKAREALRAVRQYQRDWQEEGVNRVDKYFDDVEGDWLEEFND